ncbi:hypothetical protein Mgra_00000420 [Meloidogyne graminicola]|uniref:Uncharacterized protein n=1 Tax=Meloidogyne graminicola TaxID=189291 RepID=A0A8T0A3S4_9BILA|nr:hypothetical protein Mgra_00000420 [Meloidogyne graminicola]
MNFSSIFHFYFLKLFLLIISPFCSFAILCRTGVDLLGGPIANCGRINQCMNTTSSLGQTVYSCDFAGFCDNILNLRDSCIRDGNRMVCCCSNIDGCNFGLNNGILPNNLNIPLFNKQVETIQKSVSSKLEAAAIFNFPLRNF